MAEASRTYLPAAGHDWALPFYDPLVWALGGNPTRKTLIDQATIRPAQRVLEIGCGTGSLALQIKRLHPDVEVVGLDPDGKALNRARRKATRAAVSIRFDQAFSDQLPYPDASFDRVFSSFMFHHLQGDQKEETLREVRRVLGPGGSLHLVDFAGSGHSQKQFLARWLHSHDRLKDNSEEQVLALMSRAGLTEAKKVREGRMLLGHLRLNYYQASVPTEDVRSSG